MFEPTHFFKADDLRQHRSGGDLHIANAQCETDGCSRVTVAISLKIDEPGIGAVVSDGGEAYLNSGTLFTRRWRRIGAKAGTGRTLYSWDELSDNVKQVRPALDDVAAFSVTSRPLSVSQS